MGTSATRLACAADISRRSPPGKAFRVSCAILGRIETRKSTRIRCLPWEVVIALDVPLLARLQRETTSGAAVLTRDETKLLSSSDGRFTACALFPFDLERAASRAEPSRERGRARTWNTGKFNRDLGRRRNQHAARAFIKK